MEEFPGQVLSAEAFASYLGDLGRGGVATSSALKVSPGVPSLHRVGFRQVVEVFSLNPADSLRKLLGSPHSTSLVVDRAPTHPRRKDRRSHENCCSKLLHRLVQCKEGLP